MERDLSEANKTVKHAYFIMAACNWIGIDITQSLFLYSIEKEKNGNYLTESIYFFQIRFVNLYACVAILLIFFPPI